MVGYDDAMRFGIATFITDDGIRPEVLGQALEERGFSSLFIAEHSHIPAGRESPDPSGGELLRRCYRTLDPFVALTAVAIATSRLVLGTGIALLPQRDVIHTASTSASTRSTSGRSRCSSRIHRSTSAGRARRHSAGWRPTGTSGCLARRPPATKIAPSRTPLLREQPYSAARSDLPPSDHQEWCQRCSGAPLTPHAAILAQRARCARCDRSR